MKAGKEQSQLTLDLIAAQRELSTVNVLFQHAVAERVGLNATDYRCWQALTGAGAISAGQLAELAGLTTSAITGILDRLENAGLVTRRPDTRDRRRVIVEPVQERRTEIAPLYASVYRATTKLFSQYDEAEMAVILRFLEQSVEIMRKELARLKNTPSITAGRTSKRG